MSTHYQPQAQSHDRRDDNLIPFPGPTGPQQISATGGEVAAVLDRELVGGPGVTQRPMPVVLPPWLRSRDTALATLWWAVRYTGRHIGFHAWRLPAYGLALLWWTLRGVGRALAAGFGWVSVRGEYRPLITAAREAKGGTWSGN